MHRESITIQMDGEKAGRLRQLAAKVGLTLENYCAAALELHIMRKADIAPAQGGDK